MDWDFWKTVIAGQARHLLTVAAGAMVAQGALSSQQEGAFVEIGTGLVVWAATSAWSWYQKYRAAK